MEPNENNQTPILYGAFVLVLLAAFVLAPSPSLVIAAAAVLLMFYQTNAAPSDAIFQHEAHF
ncbi:hypothetical protein HY994_01165 [Candidatus Micrarchaeota archaeon]|nr:hypothetical protein [Candidatus Micrarchaeota archaeon]